MPRAAVVGLLTVLTLLLGVAAPIAVSVAAQDAPPPETETGTAPEADPAPADTDGDGIPDDADNCAEAPNPGQQDRDGDGQGNPCDADQDGDGVADGPDNCPKRPNPGQSDADGDGRGNACDKTPRPPDTDADDDGIENGRDTCRDTPNPGQRDLDGDGAGNACDPDKDGDGVANAPDTCPTVADAGQADADGDGTGDACDDTPLPPDGDGDGIADGTDNCPGAGNAGQKDADGDGVGDACDAPPDGDADGAPDTSDTCPGVANADQADADGDGVGDACDDPATPTPTPTPAPPASPSPRGRDARATPTPAPSPSPAPDGAGDERDDPVPVVSGAAIPVPGSSLVTVTLPGIVVRIDAGGEGVTVGRKEWEADAHFERGKDSGKKVKAAEVEQIQGTKGDALYLTERRSTKHKGAFGYRVPVPEDGAYTVRLHFAELYWGAEGGGAGGPGRRVFDVNAEGRKPELDDYDIYREAGGAMRAVVEEFEVEVADGTLDLRFRASAGQPTVAAIEITGEPVRVSVPAATSGGLLAPGSGIGVTMRGAAVRATAGGEVIGRLPADAPVILTGIAAAGSYYVHYGGGLGWVATADLAVPTGSPALPAVSTEQVVAIIEEAAARYDQPAEDMLRVASCESWLSPGAVNPSGSYGLFQFVATTWASTPYAEYSMFDPWASANAAGWMWSVGRRGEWVCQ